MRLWFCDHYDLLLPPGHKFPTRKYRLLREALASDGRFTFEAAPFAGEDTIRLAHDPEYVRGFLDGTLDARVLRRIGFPWSGNLVKRTLASVGGTLAAAHDALDNGWAGTSPAAPITHSGRKARDSAYSTTSPSASVHYVTRAASAAPP